MTEPMRSILVLFDGKRYLAVDKVALARHGKVIVLFRTASLALLSTLAACASFYVEPEPAKPHAILHMVTNHSHLTISGWLLHSDQECQDGLGQVVAGFSALYRPDKAVRIPADETKYLLVRTNTTGVSPDGRGCLPGEVCIGTCRVEFEITPLTGRKYAARHFGHGGACGVSFVDENTGLPVPEIRQVKVGARCR
jgi:hypothetical protein